MKKIVGGGVGGKERGGGGGGGGERERRRRQREKREYRYPIKPRVVLPCFPCKCKTVRLARHSPKNLKQSPVIIIYFCRFFSSAGDWSRSKHSMESKDS